MCDDWLRLIECPVVLEDRAGPLVVVYYGLVTFYIMRPEPPPFL